MLGILLPFVLIIGTGVLSKADWLQPSISHYYYSAMHIAFVGVLCLLCGFLVCYRGPEKYENRLSSYAGFFALGVAMFPTACKGFIGIQYFFVPDWQKWFNWIHYGSAALLFVCFAIFCFRIFRESDDKDTPRQTDTKKVRRNHFYTTCGYIIVASVSCIVIIALYECLAGPSSWFTYTTFIFETTSLLAFGFSWLLKGTYGMPKLSNQKIVGYFR
jgi:hypothetical protein